MPFKHKTTKKISYNKKNAVTLDNKHMEFLNEFTKDVEYTIPQLKQERSTLREVLKTELTVEQRIETEERIHEISKTAEKILKKKGFAEKFESYMHKGWYSLSSPVWANFGNGRGLSISCNGSYVSDTMNSILEKTLIKFLVNGS